MCGCHTYTQLGCMRQNINKEIQQPARRWALAAVVMFPGRGAGRYQAITMLMFSPRAKGETLRVETIGSKRKPLPCLLLLGARDALFAAESRMGPEETKAGLLEPSPLAATPVATETMTAATTSSVAPAVNRHGETCRLSSIAILSTWKRNQL